MKYVELFAGAGGMSLGLERAGMTCLWHSEIDPFCQKILQNNFPSVPVYGDVAEQRGKELNEKHGQPDLVSGGSPCQDMSICGKRIGLKGLRSSLFYEQIRLWKETEAPLCLWENVTGALSSNFGKDFGRVLSTFVGTPIAMSRKKRKRVPWGRSGIVIGPLGVAAWRVLDAQFFGVPQRRKRVFVICSRSRRFNPAEILLECEGLCGDSSESRVKRNTSPSPTEDCASGASKKSLAFHHTQSPISGEISPALSVNTPGMGVLTLRELVGTINGRTSLSVGEGDAQNGHIRTANGKPRRLTPIECERLMGWPDGWTNLENGKESPDKHRYRVIGNGVATPVAHWIGLQIMKQIDRL